MFNYNVSILLDSLCRCESFSATTIASVTELTHHTITISHYIAIPQKEKAQASAIISPVDLQDPPCPINRAPSTSNGDKRHPKWLVTI